MIFLYELFENPIITYFIQHETDSHNNILYPCFTGSRKNKILFSELS